MKPLLLVGLALGSFVVLAATTFFLFLSVTSSEGSSVSRPEPGFATAYVQVSGVGPNPFLHIWVAVDDAMETVSVSGAHVSPGTMHFESSLFGGNAGSWERTYPVADGFDPAIHLDTIRPALPPGKWSAGKVLIGIRHRPEDLDQPETEAVIDVAGLLLVIDPEGRGDQSR